MNCNHCANVEGDGADFSTPKMREMPIPNLFRIENKPVREPKPGDRMILTRDVFYQVNLYQCPACKSIDIE